MNLLHLVCAQCGAQFSRHPAHVKDPSKAFCSRECANTWQRVQGLALIEQRGATTIEAHCEQCGKPISKPPSVLASRKHIFCSRSCKARYESEHPRTRSNAVRRTFVCEICGRRFSRYPSQLTELNQRFCSQTCRAEATKERKTLICKTCGQPFVVKEVDRVATAIYCSLACRSADGRVECVCEECGKSFEIKAADQAKGSGRFCSWACRQTYNAKRRVLQTCQICAKTFEIHAHILERGHGVYCSRECASIGAGQRLSKRITLYCWQCNASIEVKPSQVGRDRGHFCSRSCRAIFYAAQMMSPSQEEIAFLDAVQGLGVIMERQRRFGRYFVDAYIPFSRLVLEYDGVYWHQYKTEYDAQRDAFLVTRGLRILHITDIEWHTDPVTVLAKVKASL